MNTSEIRSKFSVDENPHIVVADKVQGVGFGLVVEEPIADFAGETEIVQAFVSGGIQVKRPGPHRVVVGWNLRGS